MRGFRISILMTVLPAAIGVGLYAAERPVLAIMFGLAAAVGLAADLGTSR